MMRLMTRVLGAAALASFVFAISGCCGGGNASKTAACKGSTSSDDCKTCCGGNYSFVGSTPDSCTCY